MAAVLSPVFQRDPLSIQLDWTYSFVIEEQVMLNVSCAELERKLEDGSSLMERNFLLERRIRQQVRFRKKKRREGKKVRPSLEPINLRIFGLGAVFRGSSRSDTLRNHKGGQESRSTDPGRAHCLSCLLSSRAGGCHTIFLQKKKDAHEYTRNTGKRKQSVNRLGEMPASLKGGACKGSHSLPPCPSLWGYDER